MVLMSSTMHDSIFEKLIGTILELANRLDLKQRASSPHCVDRILPRGSGESQFFFITLRRKPRTKSSRIRQRCDI
jgi:hypothetical protein